MLDWLRVEISLMTGQEAYEAVFAKASAKQLSELFRLRDKFAEERRREEAERKLEEHFEMVIQQSKVRPAQPYRLL